MPNFTLHFYYIRSACRGNKTFGQHWQLLPYWLLFKCHNSTNGSFDWYTRKKTL